MRPKLARGEGKHPNASGNQARRRNTEDDARRNRARPRVRSDKTGTCDHLPRAATPSPSSTWRRKGGWSFPSSVKGTCNSSRQQHQLRLKLCITHPSAPSRDLLVAKSLANRQPPRVKSDEEEPAEQSPPRHPLTTPTPAALSLALTRAARNWR
jgi:hypothetical protein